MKKNNEIMPGSLMVDLTHKIAKQVSEIIKEDVDSISLEEFVRIMVAAIPTSVQIQTNERVNNKQIFEMIKKEAEWK